MSEFHKLFNRQLKKLNLSKDHMPDNIESWNQFLENINKVYLSHDKERYLNFRSMEISSEEMRDSFKTIQEQQEKIHSNVRLVALGEMAGSIAHEINNPLMIILNHAKAIKKNISEFENETVDSLNKSSDAIFRSTVRVVEVIKIMRNLWKIPGNMENGRFSIQQLIEDTLRFNQGRLISAGITMEYKKIDTELYINCSLIQISQVLNSLFTNSIDAVMNLEKKWIKIDLVCEKKIIKIIFTDSSGGISRDDQFKIFQPFFTTKDVGKGTGLSLSLSKSIINQYGGDFQYDESSINTSFIISLPCCS